MWENFSRQVSSTLIWISNFISEPKPLETNLTLNPNALFSPPVTLNYEESSIDLHTFFLIIIIISIIPWVITMILLYFIARREPQRDVNRRSALKSNLTCREFRQRSSNSKEILLNKDSIILHQFPVGEKLPCISPIGLKLETFIRILSIKLKDIIYDCDKTGPWLTFDDGKMIKGIEPCIRFLEKSFSAEMEIMDITKCKRVPMIEMLDNHFYGLLHAYHWGINKGQEIFKQQPQTWRKIYGSYKEAKDEADRFKLSHNGRDKNVKEDVLFEIGRQLDRMANNLGNYPFFGEKNSNELDATNFGILAQLVWSCEGSDLKTLIMGYPNLIDFCNGIREMYFYDWGAERLDTPQIDE